MLPTHYAIRFIAAVIILTSCHSTSLVDAYYSLYDQYDSCLNLALAIGDRLYSKGYRDIWIIIGQPAYSDSAHANIRNGKEELFIFGEGLIEKWFEFKYQPNINMKTMPGHYYIYNADAYAKVFMISDGFEWFVTNVESQGIEVKIFKWARNPAHRKLFYRRELPVFLTSRHLNK